MSFIKVEQNSLYRVAGKDLMWWWSWNVITHRITLHSESHGFMTWWESLTKAFVKVTDWNKSEYVNPEWDYPGRKNNAWRYVTRKQAFENTVFQVIRKKADFYEWMHPSFRKLGRHAWAFILCIFGKGHYFLSLKGNI